MRVAALLGLLVLAIAGGYGVSLLRSSASTAPEAGPEAEIVAMDSNAAAIAAGAAETAVGSVPTHASFVHEGPNVATMAAPATVAGLPPDSMPLSQSADALATAMRSGSREATLRLLRQTAQCKKHRDAQSALDFALAFQASKISDDAIALVPNADGGPENEVRAAGANLADRMANSAAGEVAGLEGLCAGFDDSNDGLRFEAQWRAALLGDLEGLLSFVVDPAIDRFRAFEQFDRIDRYRERALGFATQAMSQHSAQAVAQLMNAHDPGWLPADLRADSKMPAAMRAWTAAQTPAEPLRQIAGIDAVAAYRYAQLCERVCPDRQRAEAEAISARLRGEISGEDRERAEREATRLREQHFPDSARAPWIAGLGDDAAPASKPGL